MAYGFGLVTSELWSANIMWGSSGLCEGLKGKRLLGLVKIKWPITCFLRLFELFILFTNLSFMRHYSVF